MRVVDTNVFVSASMSLDSPPSRVIDHWRAATYELICSSALLAELREVLNRSALRRYVRLNQSQVDELLSLLRSQSTWVEPVGLVDVVTNDSDDNRILEAAVAGQADVIVTGDQQLLALGEYASVPIMTPRAFLDYLERPRRRGP